MAPASLHDDETTRQRTRLRIFAAGALSYLPTLAFLGWLLAHERLDTRAFWAICALDAAINAGFLALFMSGLNQRFRDRTLAVPQIAFGIASNVLVLAAVGEYRAVYLIFCVTPLLFGAFKLRLGQMLRLTAFSQFGYAAMLGAVHWRGWQPIDWSHEILLWVVLSVQMLWVSGVAAMIGTLRRKLYASYAEAAHLSNTDPLTGVLNRRAVLHEMKEATRSPGAGSRASVLAMIDVDHFKRVNDSHGHDIGDQLLRTFTDAVRRHVRDADRFGRFGGDEFVLLLCDTDEAGARRVLERIQAAAAQIRLPGVDVAPTVSIGAVRLVDGASIEAAIARADEALYRVKNGERGRLLFDQADDIAGRSAFVPI